LYNNSYRSTDRFNKTIFAATGFILAASTPLLAGEGSHTASSSLFDTIKGTLSVTQKNPDNILAEVSAPTKQNYSAVVVNSGSGTPMKFRFNSMCPAGTSGNLLPPITSILTSGVLQELIFLGPQWLERLTPGYSESQNNDITVNLLNDADIAAKGFTPASFLPGGQSYAQALNEKIREMALEKCNQRLQNVFDNNPGISEASAFRKSAGTFQLNWPQTKAQQLCRQQSVSLEGQSGSTGNTEIFELLLNTSRLNVIGKIQCVSPYKPPEPGATGLTVAFGVGRATLNAFPKNYKGVCPKTINFGGYIQSQGTGQLIYQILDKYNNVHSTKVVQVTKSGEQKVNFSVTFDPSQSPDPDSGPGGLTTNPGGGDTGPAFAAPATPTGGGGGGIQPGASDIQIAPDASNTTSGWYRIKIIKPAVSNVFSNLATYKVACEKPPFEPGITVAPQTPPPFVPGIIVAPQTPPPPVLPKVIVTPAPDPTKPKTRVKPVRRAICTGGRQVGKKCACPRGKFAKKVGKNAYRCQPRRAAIKCIGGKLRGQQCSCPRGWKKIKTNQRAVRCIKPRKSIRGINNISCIGGKIIRGKCVRPAG